MGHDICISLFVVCQYDDRLYCQCPQSDGLQHSGTFQFSPVRPVWGIIGILLAVLFIKLFAVKGTLLLVIVSSAIILIFIFRNRLKKYLNQIKDKNENAPPLKDRLSDRVDAIRDKQRIKKEVKATKERTSETTLIPMVGDYDDHGSLFEPYQINESNQPHQGVEKPLFEPVTGVIPPAKKKTRQDPFGFIEEDADEPETPMKIHENFLKPPNFDDLGAARKAANKEFHQEITAVDETQVLDYHQPVLRPPSWNTPFHP